MKMATTTMLIPDGGPSDRQEGGSLLRGQIKFGHTPHDEIYHGTQPSEPAKIAVVAQPCVTTRRRDSSINSTQVFVSVAQ
jgi:hypothetical protein